MPITFVQRFGGLVNLDVHFHLVVPDGVFVNYGFELGGSIGMDFLQVARAMIDLGYLTVTFG